MPRTRRQSEPDLEEQALPRIDSLRPASALPSGEIEALGANLGPVGGRVPELLVDGEPALLTMSRPSRLCFRAPEGSQTSTVVAVGAAGASNAMTLPIAHLLAEGLHPVTSPAVSASGMIYATISGQRGKETPVSVMRISPDGRGAPFVTGLMNATGLVFNPNGDLFVTSRAEGTVYRIDSAGEYSVYAEGMGVATGAAFDAHGNLYVGDRSGTIFKIDPQRRIFVHATLEPSVSAYHLAMGPENMLYVTGPTLSSNEAVWTIDANGETHLWYRGLGRPQGLALDKNGNVFLAACLHGRRGVVRITPQGEAGLVLAGNNLVGLAFSPLGTTILATNEAVYEADLGAEGYSPFSW